MRLSQWTLAGANQNMDDHLDDTPSSVVGETRPLHQSGAICGTWDMVYLAEGKGAGCLLSEYLEKL